MTDRFELGARVPFVHRSDASIVAPVAGSTNNDAAATIDSSVKGSDLGDIKLIARYQLLDGHNRLPYLIGNLQGDNSERHRSLLDPARCTRPAREGGDRRRLLGNFAERHCDPTERSGRPVQHAGLHVQPRQISQYPPPPVVINHVDPGDAISASAGIGISFNQRTTLNLGYTHAWALGTKTRTC